MVCCQNNPQSQETFNMRGSVKSFIYFQISWLIVGIICGGIKQKSVGDIAKSCLVLLVVPNGR